MKTVILAAGQGTRLRPLTDDTPKPLVELSGRPLLDYQLDVLTDAGLEDITVVGGYRGEQLDSDRYDVIINEIYDETNMVYSLLCAAEAFPDTEDLLISYGDIIYEKAILDAVIATDAPVTVAVDYDWRELWNARFDDPLDDAETLDIDSDGRIHEIGQEPDSYEEIDAQYMGLIRIRSDLVSELKPLYDELLAADGIDAKNMFMTDFIQHLIDRGYEVVEAPIEGGWIEVDSVSDLRLYEEHNISVQGYNEFFL